ncbi:MAG TPA: ABC transporter permease [Blastocatellia bacterium]|nr:ABC transporter permease [Blastocatellia bacterium]
MSTLIQDLRYAARMMIKQPLFFGVAVIALALGIGANTAIFTVVNGVLLQPLPHDHPDQLVWLWDSLPKLPTAPTSAPEFLDWRDQNQSFEHLAAFQGGNIFVDDGNAVEDTPIGLVTVDFFSVFRVKPLLGRTFAEEETLPGRHRVVVLSQSLWQKRFGSDPNILGQTIKLMGIPHTIVGVLPAGFSFPNEAQIWRPIPIDPKTLDRGPHYLRVVGRLKSGVPLPQAQAEMSTIASRLSEQHPEKTAGHGIKLELLRNVIVGDIGTALFVLLGAVGFVLLIACANVANLLLARANARQREIAIRTALGASRGRVVRQLLTESVLLSLAGGAAGVLIALWGVGALISLSPDTIPRVKEIHVDFRVASFALLVSLVTGVVFGLAPALQVSKPNLTDALKESGRTTGGVQRNRLRSSLVVLEIALSLVLLIGAGLMIKSFAKLNRINPGFNPNNLLTMGVTLLRTNYPEDENVAAFYSQMLDRLNSTPGVQSAGAITELPLSGGNTSDNFTIEGRPPIAKQDQPLAECRVVTPHYFESMGIPLLQGRDFLYTDTKQTPNVALINEAFARRHFPGEDPLGHRLSLQGQSRDPLLIVGIVGDVRDLTLEEPATPEIYFPYLQNPLFDSFERSVTVVVRTKSSPTGMVEGLRAELLSMDKTLPVYALKPMTEYLSDSLSKRRFNLVLLSVFAAVAVLLAAVGIYGVISYVVSQRTHEIGIRVAVGAHSIDILRLIVGQAMILTLVGIAIGIGAALALTRLMESLLFDVSVTDPLTFVVISAVLTSVALAACFVPALRATRVDPMIALRYE